MTIPYKPEKQSYKEFLKFQKEIEGLVNKLHKDTANILSNIVSRNAKSDGKINKAKLKIITDKYLKDELKKFQSDLMTEVVAGVSDSAELGAKSIVAGAKPQKKTMNIFWINTVRNIRKEIVNLRALDGLTLSERIWKLAQDNEYQLKRVIGGGILQGNSAENIGRDIRKFLVGVSDVIPGRGIYKSARKNALRITRTETNRAYVDGQKETAKAMGYKLKFQISGINVCDVCTGFNGEIFDPEDFPAPVHPHCMCYGLTVLPEKE